MAPSADGTYPPLPGQRDADEATRCRCGYTTHNGPVAQRFSEAHPVPRILEGFELRLVGTFDKRYTLRRKATGSLNEKQRERLRR